MFCPGCGNDIGDNSVCPYCKTSFFLANNQPQLPDQKQNSQENYFNQQWQNTQGNYYGGQPQNLQNYGNREQQQYGYQGQNPAYNQRSNGGWNANQPIPDGSNKNGKSKKKVIIIILAAIAVVAIAIGIIYAVSKSKNDSDNAETKEETEVTIDVGETIDSGTCGDNLTWTLDDNGNLIIEGTGEMDDYEDYAPWHDERESIKACVIRDGVTSIGDWAFDYCYSLTSITIPDSVTSIGDYAFESCSLTSITIPDGVTSIGDFAFGFCGSLTSITISDSVTAIGYATFYNCSSLTSVTIPDSVTSIGEGAFCECDSLTDVNYGGSEGDRDNIEIGDSNSCLTDATWHYNYNG